MTGLRGDRVQPARLWDAVVVPGPLCAELAAALDLLEAFVRGTPPPAACRAARLSRAALAVREAAREAAVDHQRQQTRRTIAAASTPAATVLTSASAPAPSNAGEEITTEQAASLTGLTEGRIRQLAAAGTIRGRKGSRDVWLLDPADVRAYRERMRRSGTHGGTDTERAAG